MDDHTQTLVDAAKQGEPANKRNGIYPVGDYSFWASGGHIQAMKIASMGGVAWEHENGAYMFIKDANGLAVCDFRPRSYKTLYAPVLPLQRRGDGVLWSSSSR